MLHVFGMFHILVRTHRPLHGELGGDLDMKLTVCARGGYARGWALA